MKRAIFIIISLVFLIFLLVLLNQLTNITEDKLNQSTNITEDNSMYKKITPEEAKNIIDSNVDYIIVDVRTQEEYEQGHISGAILIPDYDISQKAQSILTDKNKQILVYCRSGRRSAIASKQLISLGYTNVMDFGGIIDWKYGIVN